LYTGGIYEVLALKGTIECHLHHSILVSVTDDDDDDDDGGGGGSTYIYV